PSIKRLGWEAKSGEAHADALLRSLVISRLGRSGDKKTITFARDLFKAMQKGEQIHPDIRGAIYGIVATHSGMKEYKALIKKYKAETLHEEKNRIGSALGDFRDDKILCLSMHFALSNEVRIQDTIGIFSGIGANPLGRNIWLKSLKQNWKMLVTRYGDGGMALGRMVKAIGGSAEKKHLDDFKKFFATHDAPGAKRSVDQVIERLESNVAWLTRDGKAIEKFLK
ncbi:MAG: ERAP1-like C-terminal domain-containing protein, partial [Candidatus Pacebacteria bacterium]|nr:ERAP1-like C-terminal domain-containing protein [Candidatus Paceibacterota bacterium]